MIISPQVYVASVNGHVYAVNSSNGAVMFSFAANGSVYATPAIDTAGNLLFGSFDGNLYKVSSTLEVVWAVTIGYPMGGSVGLAPDGTAYVGDNGCVASRGVWVDGGA